MVKYGDPLHALAGGHTTVEIHKLFFINYSVLTEENDRLLKHSMYEFRDFPVRKLNIILYVLVIS